MFARLRAETVPRTEDAFGAAGGGLCTGGQVVYSVPEKGVSGTEYPFRTGKACFLHRMPLKMRRVPEKAVFDTEYLFRTVEACFCAPSASENASRTVGGCFALLKLRPVHQEALSGTEYHLRTPEAFF